jgi:hypothetical protein
MDGLRLGLSSFADMTLDRALAVARAFDAHPALRPVKVGGDPARIEVEPSMVGIIGQHGLPADWLTVRRNGGYPDFEGGEIRLMRGRGGFIGTRTSGAWEFSLTAHEVQQHWLAATMSNDGLVAEAAALFEDLAVAMDAAYGYVGVDSIRVGAGAAIPTKKLPGVFWLNYFGSAFLLARPALASVGGARVLSTGGVLVQTSAEPWLNCNSDISGSEGKLLEFLGEEAFRFAMENPALPSVSDHLEASPGTAEMPWVGWEASRDAADRARKYASARRRLAKALNARVEPVLAPEAVEWSTSFDLKDWQEFAQYLTRSLRGNFSAAVGKATLAAIVNAPLDDEDAVLLDTKLGVIRLGWFIDDTDTVDAYIYGSPRVHQLCNAWFTE